MRVRWREREERVRMGQEREKVRVGQDKVRQEREEREKGGSE